MTKKDPLSILAKLRIGNDYFINKNQAKCAKQLYLETKK